MSSASRRNWTVLDNEDAATWGGLFHRRTNDGTALPGRRGYYLGYLVAREAGKRHSLQELARLDCGGARSRPVDAARLAREGSEEQTGCAEGVPLAAAQPRLEASLRRAAAAPNRPRPNSATLPGSGTWLASAIAKSQTFRRLLFTLSPMLATPATSW